MEYHYVSDRSQCKYNSETKFFKKGYEIVTIVKDQAIVAARMGVIINSFYDNGEEYLKFVSKNFLKKYMQ